MKNPITEFIKKIVTSEVDAQVAQFKKDYDKNATLPSECGDGMNDVYLFDFKAGWRGTSFNSVPASANLSYVDGIIVNEESDKTIKVKVKPVDVVHALERKPKTIDLALLDEKIQVLQDKKSVIQQSYSRRELDAMIDRLEARKLYKDNYKYFELFDNTDDDKIKDFLKKYDLVMETADIFVPDFPPDAIKIMKGYQKQVKKITDKKPIFYVIAEKEDFEYADDKRDPILLAQSPFGFYWQILGAWDKELEYLADL